MASYEFRSVLTTYDIPGAWHDLAVPADVSRQLGTTKQVPVKGTINTVAFRTTAQPRGDGTFRIVVDRAMRDKLHVSAGDELTVVMERDDEPRVVTVPDDILTALKANERALAAWEKLSYSSKKHTLAPVLAAKRPETRQRGIARIVDELSARNA